MAISGVFGTGASTGTATATSIGIALGTGSGSPFAAGDIIIIVAAKQSSTGNWTTPTGFTAVPTTASSSFVYFYRICTGSGDPSSTSLSISISSANYFAATTLTITGAAGFDPSATAWSTSTLTAASITLAHSGDLALWLGAEQCTASFITPTLGVPASFTLAPSSQSAGKTSGSGSSRLGGNRSPAGR
jgi:hypothetical protein